MSKSAENDEFPNQTRKYQKIDRKQREQVLQLLLKDKLSLQEVANQLELKYCTVRTIQKAFEKDGRIGKKETRKKKTKIQNIFKVSILNPLTLQLSQPITFQENCQIYVDKLPTSVDQENLQNTQKQLVDQQLQNLFQAINNQYLKNLEQPNYYYLGYIQNMLIATQVIAKQLEQANHGMQPKPFIEPVISSGLINPLHFQQNTPFLPSIHSFQRV